MAKILILGGGGCLGSNLLEHWIPAGHEIHVVDNFLTGKRELVPAIKNLTLSEGDISDESLIARVFHDFNPQIIINSAASYNDPENITRDMQTNAYASALIRHYAQKFAVAQIINFQTILCYGNPQYLPMDESHPLNPFTSYSISKTAGEQIMMQSSIPTLSLRISNITGARLAIGPIPTFYKRLKAGQGCFCTDSARDFLAMADFINLMDKIIAGAPKHGIYNVAMGESHSIKEIFDLVAEHLGLGNIAVPIKPVGDDDVALVSLNNDKVRRDFAWAPQVNFTQLIKNQCAWYDKYGISEIYSHLRG